MGRRKQPVIKGSLKIDRKPRVFYRGPGGRFVKKSAAAEVGATRERYQMQTDSKTGRIIRGLQSFTRTSTTKVIVPDTIDKQDSEQGLITRALSKSSVFKTVRDGQRAYVTIEGIDAKTGKRVVITRRDLDLRAIAEKAGPKKRNAVLNKVVVGHIANILREHGYRPRYPVKTVQAKLEARGKTLREVPKQGPKGKRINVNRWAEIKKRTELLDMTITVRVFKK